MTGPITLDDTKCTWVGGVAGASNAPAKNTAVLGATASSANKLNPTCSICPTSPTADEPTGCPMYTTPATVGSPGGSGDMYPSLGFDMTGTQYDGPPGATSTPSQPIYIPNDVIIPTLDDAPDGADPSGGPGPNSGYSPGDWTITDLAFLDSIGQHWDFFLNDNNWSIVTTDPADGTCDPDGYNAYVDILKNHFPGNHTAHHVQMGGDFQGDTSCTGPQPPCCDCTVCPSNTCASELDSVESVVAGISVQGRPHLTRMRYPYGYPQQGPVQPNFGTIQPTVAKYAVAIGWHFLTEDADNDPCGCEQDSGTVCTCVDEEKGNFCATDNMNTTPNKGPLDNVTADVKHFTDAIGTGPGQGTAWGIALMHATLPWTAGAIRKLFGPGGYVSTTKYRIGSVEDAVCWKYGMHSWDIVNKVNGYTGANARGPN